MKDLSKLLCEIGFREVEAEIYLATLELGSAPASDIAKKAGVKRSSAYVILKDLMRQGYITSYTNKDIARFTARDPRLLIQEKTEKVKMAAEALPELSALYKASNSAKPRIEYFEGTKGMIAVMEDTITTGNKTILCWADIELAYDTLRDYYPDYIAKKNKRKVFVRAIVADSVLGKEFQEKGGAEQREVRLIPPSLFPMSNEINIYDDKVAIISHRDRTGVIIENKEIANTQRSIFELGWQRAGQVGK